jgi:hypothetical protein
VNALAIPRAAVDTTIKLVRRPVDSAIDLLPGDGGGARLAARSTLDRADATVRALFSSLLRDPALRESAEQRRAASFEREEALRLRQKAHQRADTADSRLQEQHEQAERQRRQARQKATAERVEADRKRQEQKRDAAATERKRLDASTRAAARDVEAVDQREARDRLETLDAKSDALTAKEQALRAADEAQRLRDSAGRIKADRKSDPNGSKSEAP